MAPFDRQIYGAEQITHVEPIVEPQIQNMAKAGSRAPTSPDDEGEPASLEGLDDDTVLIVTSFLPGDLRRGTCTKCGSFFHFDTFMVGNLLVSYQQHRGEEPSHCTKRVVLKVWRF